MIASLRGTVTALGLSSVVLDVNGVGYQVNVSPRTALALRTGELVSLHTALIVREDAFTLYGFSEPRELELFDLLRSVTGVGPKSALAVVASVDAGEIASAVANEDDAVFKRVSGIGPKTAKLITVTLAGKLQATAQTFNPDLVAALTGLGYNENAAKAALRDSSGESDSELLRAALARLSATKLGEQR